MRFFFYFAVLLTLTGCAPKAVVEMALPQQTKLLRVDVEGFGALEIVNEFGAIGVNAKDGLSSLSYWPNGGARAFLTAGHATLWMKDGTLCLDAKMVERKVVPLHGEEMVVKRSRESEVFIEEALQSDVYCNR